MFSVHTVEEDSPLLQMWMGDRFELGCTDQLLSLEIERLSDDQRQIRIKFILNSKEIRRDCESQQKDIGRKTESKLVCFTKRANCMTLYILGDYRAKAEKAEIILPKTGV